MIQSPLPDNWQELLAGYVLEDLDAPMTARVQQWIEHYPHVAAEYALLIDVWQSLPASLPPQAPPPGLRDRLLAAPPVPSSPPSPSPVPAPVMSRRSPQSGRSRWGLTWGLGAGWAMTAIALAVVLSENQQLRQDRDRAEAIVASFTQPQSQLYLLTGTEQSPAATARLLIDAEGQQAIIATQSLPALPADQVYRLWAIADDTPIFCGQFNPTTSPALSQWTLPDPACDVPAVQMLVTSEQATDPFTPQGELVLQPAS